MANAKIISVISGKGGTGKSTVSGAVSVTLAKNGASVLVIDLDIGLRALDIMLGLENAIVYDIGDVQAGKCTVENAAAAHKTYSKLKLLCAPLNVGEWFDLTKLIALINDCRRNYDYIILDLPAGLGLGVMLTRELSDLCVVITTTDAVTMRDSRKICDAIADEGNAEVKLIINKVSKNGLKMGGVIDLDEVMDAIGIPLIGVLADDGWIKSMLVPEKNLTKPAKSTVKAVEAITHRVQGEYVPLVITSL